ncbi:uncharacterized protein LOC111692573, partial [Anoplophora glabripennis]|uniref:uncharacterized protein LOC111692573 n=1 Tax=Anoplophora glabripennis TaxID=217634 RepID=UPI000C75B828
LSSSSAETPSPKRFKTDLEPDQEVIIYDDNKEDIDFLKGETSSTSTASETQDEIIKMLPGVDTETTADTATGPQTSCRGILSVVVPKVQPSKKDTVLKQKKKIKILQQSVRRHWTWVRTLHSLIEVLKKKAMITDNAETTLMNISATSEPVTCRPCLNSLGTHGGFLKEYFNAQENYKSADNESVIKSEKIKIKLEDDQDEQEKYESGEMPVYIKFEEIEIKGEEDRDGVPSSYDLDAETIESKKRRISEDVGVIKEEYKCETGFNENYGMLIDNNQLPKYEKS